MDRQESIKLLALIKVAYPTSYRDLDDASKNATVNMWQASFADVPYGIMMQAFNHFRLRNKFPPTVAEMVDELRLVHFQAEECAMMQKQIGNADGFRHYMAIVDATSRYKDDRSLGGMNLGSLKGLGGGSDAGASGNRLDRGDRVSLLDAGEG